MSKAGKQRVPDYLDHIREAISRIQAYVQSMDQETFETDSRTQDAVIRNLEVIGEACNNVSKHYPEFAKRHADVPWGFAYEMRNALAHGYFTIDLEIVWNTLQTDLPKLALQIEKLLSTGK